MLVGLYSYRNGLFPAKETSGDKENVDYFSNVKKMKTFSTCVFTFFKSFFGIKSYNTWHIITLNNDSEDF